MSRYTVRHSVNGRAGGRTGATGALAVLTDEHSGGWEPRTWLGAPAPGWGNLLNYCHGWLRKERKT